MRVLTAQAEQYYHRLLYEPISSVVEQRTVVFGDGGLARPWSLEGCDVFHLHSPEDLPLGADPSRHQAFSDQLRDAGIRVMWTQHNFGPHDPGDREAYAGVYELWAGCADTVVHHTKWGMSQCRDRFPFRPDARHRVIPHGHFGPLMPELATLDPNRCRSELGLEPNTTCVGIIGHPRAEKQVQLAMAAFVRAGRSDLQLLVLSLRPGEVAPRNDRIVALVHQPVPRPEYNRRLRAVDVVLLPFAPGMLTTGSVADVVALGVPAVVSDWPFLTEVLGDAGIVYGAGEDALAACLAQLSTPQLHQSQNAMRRLRPAFDYTSLSALLLEALRETSSKSGSDAKERAER